MVLKLLKIFLMRTKINCIIAVLLLSVSSCKRDDSYVFKYSKNVFNPQFFSSSCAKLFDYNVSFVELDTLYYKFLNSRQPIYNLCLKDIKFKGFFTSALNERMPFYNGDIKAPSNLTLFSFDRRVDDHISSSNGYILIKRKNGVHLVFKAYELGVKEGESIKSFYENDHIIITRKVDLLYDLVDDWKRKEVVIYFCILKIEQNGDVRLLGSKTANVMLETNFFHNLPYVNN